MATQELWTIDVDRSALRFSLRHKLLGEIGGQFHCWGGQLRIDSANPREAEVRIWVELSSIDTGSASLDEQILRTELFDQRDEPALEFDGERLEMGASYHFTLLGWLGLHSFRKEISVAVADCALETGTSAPPRFVCTARASVERKALGLRRQRGLDHWLSEQLLGETIDIAAHIEAEGSAATAARRLLSAGVGAAA